MRSAGNIPTFRVGALTWTSQCFDTVGWLRSFSSYFPKLPWYEDIECWITKPDYDCISLANLISAQCALYVLVLVCRVKNIFCAVGDDGWGIPRPKSTGSEETHSEVAD